MYTFSPKNNNRIALGIGVLTNDADVDYKKVMPFTRSWGGLLVMMLFFIPMWFAEITVFLNAVDLWSNWDDFFLLIIALFTTFWLILWSLGTIVITVVVLCMAFGRGALLIYDGRFEIHLGIPGISYIVREAAADVTGINLVSAEPTSFYPKEGKQLQIISKHSKKKKKGKRGLLFGSNMTDQNLYAVERAIEHNKSIDAKLSNAKVSYAKRQKMQQSIRNAIHTKGMPLGESNIENPIDSDLKTEENNKRAVWALVFANLLPIAGVLLLDWRLDEIMILYWIETVIILFYHILKNIVISPYAGLFSGVMTICLTGAFMAMHLLFIWFSMSILEGENSSFGTSTSDVGQYFTTIWFAILALVISHGYSFVTHFLLNPNRHKSKQLLGLDEIIARVGVMHLTIILGMFLSLAMGAPIWSLIVLIGLKISADLNAHEKKHQEILN